MSIRFARSLSFPLPTAAKSRSAFHHRSLTLPPRLHPDHLSAAHAAVRRRDDAALASASREQKKTEKQLLRLAADARSIGRSGIALSSANAELAGVAHEVTVATAAASAAVFAGIAMLASAAVAGLSAAGLSPKCVVGTMLWRSAAFKKRVEEEGERWREKAMEKMEAVEKSISELEVWSHRVFRRMLNTRVFLLNAQTPILENEIFLR
ncbi:hypothetical protein MA16_Dca010151 [Dendrobium catenatum]|uniref:Uncharacterized protein n=1 Tax=Dendrobium catenatum TaxID=906689 RepID=A0A2I0X766_9ASPA|nr:hypothetical protein MA16_Dca010151 [Dendrobium catenatum]